MLSFLAFMIFVLLFGDTIVPLWLLCALATQLRCSLMFSLSWCTFYSALWHWCVNVFSLYFTLYMPFSLTTFIQKKKKLSHEQFTSSGDVKWRFKHSNLLVFVNVYKYFYSSCFILNLARLANIGSCVMCLYFWIGLHLEFNQVLFYDRLYVRQF